MELIDFDEPILFEAIYKGEEGGPDANTEFAQVVAMLWMDIIELRNYPYDDDSHWDTLRGPKFYVTSRETGSYLVRGEFKELLKLWKKYCKAYYGKDSDS